MSGTAVNPIRPQAQTVRLQVQIRGAVQGVGFRPFVYRLARELGINGWVMNSPGGVTLDVEGPRPVLDGFLRRIDAERPPHAAVQGMEVTEREPAGLGHFEIRTSEQRGEPSALVLPDLATCPDCLHEVFDPADRRHGYPFTNCTHCGPRFSILTALPYDRANTTMSRFALCAKCEAEYHDPGNRRFHAQPNACPRCGPQLQLWDAKGRVVAEKGAALTAAGEALRAGQIVAVKGLGGFHLMVAANDEDAVKRLRLRKCREAKPFAVMFPTPGSVRAQCEISALERRLLTSPAAPIVLLRRRTRSKSRLVLASSIAPDNPWLGVMLAATPLHHLLLTGLGVPVVATSGNRSEEPLCVDEAEARTRLAGIADLFLVHDRPIARPVDDSVVRVVAGRELVLRRARGYAPLPVPVAGQTTALAVGAQLKSAVALAVGPHAFISQHLGDLETAAARENLQREAAALEQFHQARPMVVATDTHPDYASTQFAGRLAAERPGTRLVRVQHHHAHVLACMAEHDLEPPVLGIAWDGAGLGTDGTVWGGEFLRVNERTIQRVAHWRPFPLPGGDAAAREPRRAALGLLWELLGEQALLCGDLPSVQAFTPAELRLLRPMLVRGVNTPRTSSVGRLFDAAASLLGLRQKNRFEGDAAMQMEFAAAQARVPERPYPFRIANGSVDWVPLFMALLNDWRSGVPAPAIASRLHGALVSAMVTVATCVCERTVVLTGGCFQNRVLTEAAIKALRAAGCRPFWHRQVPPNDGGIALGQLVAARRELEN